MIIFMDDETALSEEEIDARIKEKMKVIEGKLKEIRDIRGEIRELNKQRVKKRAITVHVPSDKKEEIQKRIREKIIT